MIPVDQQVLHDPDNGQYGDCMRACIASLLELSPDEVPHFYETGVEEDFHKSIKKYLESKRLALLEISYIDFDEIDLFLNGIRGVHHIISGYTERGTFHATIGKDGKVVHDPHPSRVGLLETPEEWVFSFIIKIL